MDQENTCDSHTSDSGQDARTGRNSRENQLRTAHARAELFINSVPSILVGLDSEGRINRWNLAAERAFGLGQSEVFGKTLVSCGIKWLSSDIEAQIASLAVERGEKQFDGIRFEREGETRLVGMRSIGIIPSDQGTSERLIVGADITERRKAEEELRFKTAFLEAQTNATLDGLLVVDENGKRLLQNRRFIEIFEVPEELSKQTHDGVMLAHVLPKIVGSESFLQKVKYLYSHKNETSRDEIELRDGRVLDRYSSPVLGRDGHYYGRIWIFRDITDRKRSENALRQLSLAVEQSPVSVVITDLQGNITYVNRRFTETTGYEREDVLGRNPRILKSGRNAAAEYENLWNTITQGHEWRGELCNRKKNGELFWETAAISPITDSKGATTHFLAVKEEITERKMMEHQLHQAQKMEAIGQLAAGIAHEINTPIQFIGDNTRFFKEAWAALAPATSLLSSLKEPTPGSAVAPDFVDQLAQSLGDADPAYLLQEVPQALEQSLEGIGRVSKIVQAMKEFAHPGSSEKQPTNINKAILTTVTVARNEWKYVAEVETLLAEDLEPVPCHVGELNQVLLN